MRTILLGWLELWTYTEILDTGKKFVQLFGILERQHEDELIGLCMNLRRCSQTPSGRMNQPMDVVQLLSSQVMWWGTPPPLLLDHNELIDSGHDGKNDSYSCTQCDIVTATAECVAGQQQTEIPSPWSGAILWLDQMLSEVGLPGLANRNVKLPVKLQF